MHRNATVAAAALLALAGVATSVPAGAAPTSFPQTIPLPDGFQPEGITSGPGTTAYVGSLADGAIWSGDLRTGDGGVLVAGEAGQVAVGTEYDPATGRLWVVGGPTGEVRVYDAASGTLLREWTVPGAGFLNDVTVTADAVYVTDSQVQSLVVVPTPGGDLGRKAEVVPITGDLVYTAGFNANGLVDARGVVVVAQSATGLLFTVDPATGVSTQVDLGGALLTAADGLYLQGRTLFVVRNQLGVIEEVRLSGDLATGRVVASHTDPDFDVPTTATVAAGRLYAVNARFGTPPTPTTGYDIVLVDGR